MTKLEELEEAVAAAKRDVAVAEALSSEYRNKAALAEEEVRYSVIRLDRARHVLEAAVLEKHDAIHGQPVSFDDRMAFEKRWDSRIDEMKMRSAQRVKEAQDLVSEFDGEVVQSSTIVANLGLTH